MGGSEDGTFKEVIDGQQRTISICQYIDGDFAFQNRYFHNLKADEKRKDIKLHIDGFMFVVVRKAKN